MTYGSLQDVAGSLVFFLVGLLALFPWIVPLIGLPLGILDRLVFNFLHPYETALALARVQPSWLTRAWYWAVTAVGMMAGLLLTFLLVRRWVQKAQRGRRKQPDYALVHCAIFDGYRDHPLISDGVILIRNRVDPGETPGLIQAVGAWGTVDIPEDYQQLDLQGKLVLPGLINAHCHLLGDGAPTRLLELSDAMVERILALFQTPLFKLLIRRRFRQHARTALHAGITTLRVLDDFTNFALALRDRIRQGAVVGPRLLCSGAPLYPTGGHGSLEYQVDSIPEIRRAVRQNVREEVDCIKILSTGGVSDARQIGEAGRPQMTVEEIACACREAHRGYVPVASHCESTRGIRENLLGGVDTIEHGAEIPEDLIACFKDNPKAMRGYTCLVPTISAAMGLATLPWEETRITRVKYENARIVLFGMIKGLQTAYESGIKFGVGNDASVPYVPHYDLWRELSYLVTYTGMSTKEAIYYATRNNAEVLGIEDVTGSVEVGLSADLIVLDADPFEDLARLKRPRHVFIRGKFIERPDYEEVKGLKPLAPISPELVGQADTTGPGCPTQGGVH